MLKLETHFYFYIMKFLTFTINLPTMSLYNKDFYSLN
jgi:hypothetical protein